jgi:hypothetical protein
MSMRARLLVLATAIDLLIVLPGVSSAFVASGAIWQNQVVPFVINTANLDGLAGSAVEAAVRTGAGAWDSQSGASIHFSYDGPSAQTGTGYDNINLVVFRNASNGSAIATTYTWMVGPQLVDADIVFWDAGFLFFTGSTGCSGGFYIEDIATHEFGHALGLGHSTTTTATMYPSVSSCNTNPRTLDPDDIQGVTTLYPLAPALPHTPANLRVVR